MSCLPSITVAAVVEQHGRFLLVEERIEGRLVINQPAGHLDPGEDLIEAVMRETREETTRHFTPEALTGVYQWSRPDKDRAYLRFCFCGDISEPDDSLALDDEIVRTVWLTPDELDEQTLRSPMVRRCIEDYLAGRRFPLDTYQSLGQTAGDDP